MQQQQYINLNDNSFVLTVDDNRLNEFYHIFDAFGIKRPINYKGIVSEDHITACRLGHLSIMKIAKEKNLPYVIIFEDAACPCKDIINKFQRLLYDISLNNIQWDILVLGIYGETSQYTKNLFFNDGTLTYDDIKNSKTGYAVDAT